MIRNAKISRWIAILLFSSCALASNGQEYVFVRSIPDGPFFAHPYAVATDNSGNVYVSEIWDGRICKLSQDGEVLLTWGERGSGNGQFDDPRGIAVDSEGNVYIADSGNHRIQKFTSEGVFLKKWGSNGSGNGQFDLPVDVAADSLGNIYVADYSFNSRIQKFTSEGLFCGQMGSTGFR